MPEASMEILLFGLLGRETFMHPGLLDVSAAHANCYFQVFTNQTVHHRKGGELG